jgi:hypothetical protein
MKRMKRMKKLLVILSVVLMGCPIWDDPDAIRVYYNNNNATGGITPVDKTIYRPGDTIFVKEKGSLYKRECVFEGWLMKGAEPTLIIPEGQYFTAETGGLINLVAVWKYSGTEYVYSVSESSITITEYIGAEKGHVVIPQTIEKKPVTHIANDAFSSMGIYTMVLPNSLETIGKNAFSYNSLSEVTIPNSVLLIGNNAFSHNSLSEITLSDSVLLIGDNAFQYNYRLSQVILGNGIKTIGEYAFSHCDSLEKIILPDSITTVNEGVFYHCPLTEITIGSDVTISSGTSMGTHGKSFQSFYNGKKQAGTYLYDNITWELNSH